MVIVFKSNAPQDIKAGIKQKLETQGYMINEITGIGNTIFGIIGDTSALDINQLRIYDCVEKVLRVSDGAEIAHDNKKFIPYTEGQYSVVYRKKSTSFCRVRDRHSRTFASFMPYRAAMSLWLSM